ISATLPAGAANTPRALLAALVDSALPSVRGPLDAAMRWVERLTLRGAVVMAGVEAGLVNGNRIAEVGRDLAYAAKNIDGAEIRASAIAIVAAAEVVVEGNAIESVRAPYQNLDGGGGDGTSTRPEMIDVLAGLGFAPAATRIDRADVHLAASDLRSRTLAYGLAKVDQRPALAKVMAGPLEALTTELAQLAGTAGQLSEPLGREIPPMRTAQSADEHTAAANALRATLSQAASATAPDDDTKDAWDAAAQFDLATTRDPDAIQAVATRLRQRLDSLVLSLPDALKTELDTNLKRVIEAPSVIAGVLAASGTLGKVATTRAQLSRKKDLPSATDLVGPAKTVVHTFSAAAIKQLDTLAATRTGDNAARLDELRASKDALVSQLRETNGALANDLSADFLDVDRTNGSVKAAVERLRSTLGRVSGLAEGTLTQAAVSADDAARAASQGQAATIHLYAKTLDRQIAGLATESDDSAQKSLGTFKNMVGQLGDLVAAHPDLAPLAKQAATAVQTASVDATQRRAQLGIARGKLDLIRSTLAPALPLPLAIDPKPIEPIERRIAGLGALAIELDSADAGSVDPALAAFALHLDRVLDLVSADAGERQRAHDAEADAKAGLASGSPAPIRARAIHTLETLVGSASDRALSADTGQVTAQLTAAASLVQAATLVVDPSEDAATRLSRVKTYLGDRTSMLSSGIVALAQQTVDLQGLTAVIHEGLARIARGIDLVVIDDRAPAFLIAPSAADGVFAAGVERRARITGNLITEVVSGIIVRGADGHVMTEPPDDGMALELATNRIAGATAIAISARSDGSSKVTITDNQAIGCAGIAVDTGDPWGQGVLIAAGAGDLLVRGNVLSDNGNTTLRALLHEIVIDWRGPVGLRGNAVRHLGGGAGGAGLLVTTEPIDGALIGKLAQAPFLGSEPPPRPIQIGRTGIAAAASALSIRDIAPLSPLARGDNTIQIGGLRQTVAVNPILQRTLTLPINTVEAPTVAAAMASRYIDRTRLFVQHPLIDFLKRPPIRFVPPPIVRGYDCVHVEGNDIDAAGPALLLLSNGGTLIAAAVSGNDLRSRGRAGAAYVRKTDSTLFASNRCECLAVTNVVVLRPGKAPVSVTGNVIVGAEPVHQTDTQDTANQAAQTAAALKPQPGAVHLAVGLGGAKTLQIPVDARALLGTLDRRKNLASDTFSELLADIATTPAGDVAQPAGLAQPASEPSPDATLVDVRGRAIFTRDALAPRALTRGTGLSSTMLDLATRQKLAAALPGGTVANTVGAKTLYGHTAGDDDDPVTALKKVVDQVTLHEQHPETARTQVAALLTASGGDPRKALKLLDQNVLGLDTTKPSIQDSIDKVSVVHEVLGDLLSADGPQVTPAGPLAPFPIPLPPDNPADHSLVVIGGTRVAVIGNATTAGVFVQEADAHVELNP
ncbi:MAG TPA: right-handed parallel beta-helix repeat-containing protein, partial [Kofleriaceae bacterium]|nr:right-handed parallel beta-helix repeat-containing protein [Kofleriaceae bacterium]